MENVIFDTAVPYHARNIYADIFKDFFSSQETFLITKTLVHPETNEKHRSGSGFDNFEKFSEHFLEFRSCLKWDRCYEIYRYKGYPVRQFLTFTLIDKKIYLIERENETGVWNVVKKDKANLPSRSNDLEWLECYNPVDYIDCIIPTIKMLHHSRDDSEEFDPAELIHRMREGRTPCW